MIKYDLAIAFNWEYDEDFIKLTKNIFDKSQLSLFVISYNNYKEVSELLRLNKIHFRYFLDRASDSDECFNILVDEIIKKDISVINKYENMRFASDKATMHLEFISYGINTPYTIIISPYNTDKEITLSISALAQLGRPFIIKPANTTGGGIGVVKGAETLNDVLSARQLHKDDKYLLQRKIYPKEENGKRFWFRCFYAFGKIIICWWNDLTHIYRKVDKSEIDEFNLEELFEITNKIYKICQLDFFSTEIAQTQDNKFIVVDYVNEMCDLRLQSKHADGVPDNVVNEIIEALIKQISNTTSLESNN